MLYVFLEKKQIKLLFLKKTLLGQFEASFFEKKHEVDFLTDGKVSNVDLLASALKEGITSLNIAQEKQVFLILPQESFVFLKADVPSDIAPSAVTSFIQDKARATLTVDLDNYFYDYFLKDVDQHRQVTFYAVESERLEKYFEAFNLLGLKIVSLLPESLALFKLFEKTLRPEKKENILYATYSKGEISGYLYDSGGLHTDEKWVKKLDSEETLPQILKTRREELEEKGIKLNRIILTGDQSENIRQDTFTKEVGVWTNLLKRIIPDFYQEHLKVIVVQSGSPFPILAYDVCFGAFVFSQENKGFHILKNPFKLKGGKMSLSISSLPIFRKEVLIFVVSSVLSFAVFVGLSRVNWSGVKLPNLPVNIGQANKPTITPTPVPPTPTPSFKKEELKIKVLNGSGTAGKATEAKNLLKDKGYQEIVTGNADNYDFTQTVIQVKKSLVGAGKAVASDLKDSVSSPKIDNTLSENDTSDVIITIGSDLK